APRPGPGDGRVGRHLRPGRGHRRGLPGAAVPRRPLRDRIQRRPAADTRVTVVLLALAAAVTFGAMTVAIRVGLRRGNVGCGALAMLLWATALALVAALPRHDFHRGWQFFLAGLLAPGCSQVLFTLSVKEAGPSRTSVVVGAAPLIAVAIALVFL